ncbi:MAG: helix-turn-helix domain-containing protein [Anaerolineaceae bacterium]|nr:helix-turn-helix domain-containing protein [Anaerolineaceae bacterium]
MMADEGKKRLGERIRKARRDANMTQGELSERLGISQGVISNVETGVSTIDAPDLPLWAEILNKPIMYFFVEEDADPQERALAILNMFPDDRLEFVLQMLENMALTMHERTDNSS